jgi:Flp pilus assembly protein TadB
MSGGMGNWLVSLLEDVLAFIIVVIAILIPLLVLLVIAVVVILFVWVSGRRTVKG